MTGKIRQCFMSVRCVTKHIDCTYCFVLVSVIFDSKISVLVTRQCDSNKVLIYKYVHLSAICLQGQHIMASCSECSQKM